MNYKDWSYAGNINAKEIKKAERVCLERLAESRNERYIKALKSTKPLVNTLKKSGVLNEDLLSIKNHVVQIGSAEHLSDAQNHILKSAIKSMMPWRKGPFEIFGESIDAEWRSDLKWERVKKQAGSLQGKVILDVGCNNGYYLYHVAKQNPKYLLGIDPVIPYYLQYQLMSQFCPPKNTEFRLLGVEHLVHFEKVFDCVFCMGIIYHHPDPIGILRTIFNAMRPGGLLIVEAQGIKKDGPYCLLPQNRYLGLPGHWFMPSREALENMIRRSGFQYVETFSEVELDETEQRSSSHSPFTSLNDGLDSKNKKRTVEGYPAPWRFYVKARKVKVRR